MANTPYDALPDVPDDDAQAGGKPGSRTPRAQWVYNALRQAIQEGRYQRGERIREEDVARTLGVSRTPVREALSRLQTRGLLEMASGGLVIAALTRQQIMELYALREILEGSAARFAAQHASANEIAALHRISDVFSRSLEDAARLAQVNRDFHYAIYEAAHNRYLVRTLDELNDALTLLPSTTFTVSGRPEAAVIEHADVVRAIEARDAEAAERLARRHIENSQAARLELLFSYR